MLDFTGLDLQRLWAHETAKALRSGEWGQTTGKMRERSDRCAIGVGMEVLMRNSLMQTPGDNYPIQWIWSDDVKRTTSDPTLNPSITDGWVLMSDTVGSCGRPTYTFETPPKHIAAIPPNVRIALTSSNDGGAAFEQMADWLDWWVEDPDVAMAQYRLANNIILRRKGLPEPFKHEAETYGETSGIGLALKMRVEAYNP